MTTDSTVTFDNCGSAAECFQQRKQKIRDRYFIAWAETPTKSRMKQRANLEQSMPGASSVNLSAQSDRSNVRESRRKPSIVMVTNKIIVSGPRLHTGHEHPRVRQRTELRNYFSQFGKIVNVTVIKYDNSTVTFEDCESAARCIQQRTHKIRGQDFFVKTSKPTPGMKKELKKLKANPDGNTAQSSSENATIPNDQIPLPGGLTNRIFISILRKRDAKIAFDNCDSAAICIQQRTHTICGHRFIVHTETPTQSMKDKIRANLRQNMPGASSENVSGANVQSDLAAEPNLGSQSPQSTASNSSEESVICCGEVTKESPQSRGLASFEKPGSASRENLSAANVQSDPPAEPNLGNQSPKATASSLSQVQGGVIDSATISKAWAQSRGLASFDKPGIGSILRQNMPGPTSENVSAANVQSGSAVESNLGNQSLQGTVPSSSQVQGSVTDSTAQKPWHKSHGLASFDKPGYK
ncbi:hypothetical protein DdX_21495 [Ditylenchus destructor]|uniref:RRM domain-containing protein n=1 Tax=Ditylenchus destructor TaxID=166010 RepID=A0AAD4MH82_9BILA|nr:hypothetical protein DdX_21495 [Ditylenchus destructor]